MSGETGKTVSVLTYAGLPEGTEDEKVLVTALSSLLPTTHTVQTLPWDEDGWGQVEGDVGVLRTTWDYHTRLDEFLATLRAASAKAILLNPIDVIAWNASKHTYLLSMGQHVPIPPTVVVAREEGEDGGWEAAFVRARNSILDAQAERVGKTSMTATKVVLKPSVSASSRHTRVVGMEDDLGEIGAWLAEREAGGEIMLVQPFLDEIVDHGEYSVFCINDVAEYGALKTPGGDDFRVQEEFGGNTEILLLDDLPNGLVGSAYSCLQAAHTLTGSEDPFLYARVDGVIDRATGSFVLTELELIEPCMYTSKAAAVQEQNGVPQSLTAPYLLASAIVDRIIPDDDDQDDDQGDDPQ